MTLLETEWNEDGPVPERQLQHAGRPVFWPTCTQRIKVKYVRESVFIVLVSYSFCVVCIRYSCQMISLRSIMMV